MRIENSFIPVTGVGETTERRLWEHGITHWEAFDGSVVGETLADRIDRFVETGWERLERGDIEFFADSFPDASLWRLYENVAEEACFLDIETTGLDPSRNDVTTVSLHRAGETTTFVSGVDLSPDSLESALADAPLLVTFNGKRFDVPFLETCYDVDVSTPHVDLLFLCRRIGLNGGLKAIERELGIDREKPDLSGRDAVRLWHQYERGDEAALDTLVEYNRDDTANLEPLMNLVTTKLHETVFEPRRTGESPARLAENGGYSPSALVSPDA